MPRHDHEHLIRGLAAELRPVRRSWAPGMKALVWAAMCATAALALLWSHGTIDRALVAPAEDQAACIAAIVTALCAGVAMFSLAVPGRTLLWALLPMPPLLFWLAATSSACWIADGFAGIGEPPPAACFRFIVLASLPPTAFTVLMLRRSYCAHLPLVAVLAGLASSTMATALLDVIDPHDILAADFMAHVGAVGAVVVLTGCVLPRALRRWALVLLLLLPAIGTFASPAAITVRPASATPLR